MPTSLNTYLGEITIAAFGLVPKGFASCSGQLLPINQNQALFSLLGTTYGGNGQTTFALPDLRGRAPMHFGTLAGGGSTYSLGQLGGQESHTLLLSEMPAHTHVLDTSNITVSDAQCDNGTANQRAPAAHAFSGETAAVTAPYSSLTPNATMHPDTIQTGGTITLNPTGGGQAHANLQPYLALSFCIALSGIFPSQL